MKISISSDGYVYSEYIQKTKEAQALEAANTTQSTQTDEKFDKILDEIMDALKDKIKSEMGKAQESTSSSGSYTGKIPELRGYASEGTITIGSTPANYVSIAPPEYQSIFKEASETYGIDQKLLELVAYHESAFKSNAVSSAGAVGIMQLMPSTAAGLGVSDSYDPRQNILGGAKLLSRLSDQYGGDLDLVLAGYNAGTGAVRQHGGVPPYEETINYINWVRERYP